MKSDDFKNVKKIFEADPFQGVSPEDLDARRTEEQKAAKKKYDALAKERGGIPDACPNCGSDLRDVGIIQDETQYGGAKRFWNGSSWDWGDFDTWDTEVGDAACRNCDNKVEDGVDWDSQA